MVILIMLVNNFFTIILAWHLNPYIFSGNLHSSGFGGTRLLWNNGKNMVWEHISRCYFTDLELGLHSNRHLSIST